MPISLVRYEIGIGRASSLVLWGRWLTNSIWEKKYGSHANHVKKATETETQAIEKTNIASAYGNRAGPVDPAIAAAAAPSARGGVGAGRGGRGGGRGGGFADRGGHDRPVPSYTRSLPPSISAPAGMGMGTAGGMASSSGKPSDKNLHPSWEAAKLRKQKEMGAGAAPKATKIVFD